MTRRLLFVHAHPDDEASKGAATAARYVDEGVEVVLVTCTGGEAGEVLNPHAPAVAPGDMPATRARELAASVAAIGFSRAYELGFRDSGLHRDPAEVPTGTFSRVPLDEPARALAGLLRRERPHVVVTYPEDGGYPHPDHIMVNLVTMRALELAEVPGGRDERSPWRVPKVYASAGFPAERVNALHGAMLAAGLESPFDEWLRRREGRGLGPDPDARVFVGDHLERRDAALRAHASQVDPRGFWFGVPRDVERRHYPYEGYWLLRSDVLVRRPETDLFASLDEAAGDLRPAAEGGTEATARQGSGAPAESGGGS